MKKLLQWCNIFLLVFIPLYPKLPLVDVKNTWVYVRIEDFLVVFVLLLWGFLVATRKGYPENSADDANTVILDSRCRSYDAWHSFNFPTLQAVYPTVAFLSFLRRMEYMSLFFVAYSAVKDKRYLTTIVAVLVCTLLAVSIYGIGQKYLGFPAFLTMNEEFAKGIPIRLSPLSRISSTFGGHYDLAAYLVLVLPILVSMIFGFRTLFVRGVLVFSALLGFIVLFMTVSRISFFALFCRWVL